VVRGDVRQPHPRQHRGHANGSSLNILYTNILRLTEAEDIVTNNPTEALPQLNGDLILQYAISRCGCQNWRKFLNLCREYKPVNAPNSRNCQINS
jgi:hypothetical protein